MPLRPRGLPRPPQTNDAGLNRYLAELRMAIDQLPFSFFSTSDGPNASGVSAPKGTLGIEIGSSSTILWVKEDDSSFTQGWDGVVLDNAYGSLHKKFVASVATQSGISTVQVQYRGFGSHGISSGLTSDITNDLFVVSETGIYSLDFDISATGDNNTRFDFDISKNGSPTSYGAALDTGSAGEISTCAIHSMITAASDDTIGVLVESDAAGGANLETITSNFVIMEVSSR